LVLLFIHLFLSEGSEEAFVTLATNDNYSLGALVLGQSLRNVATTRKLVVLITPGVSHEMRSENNANCHPLFL